MSRRRSRLDLVSLESRLAPANVTTYHNDVQSTGVNNQESMLTRTNVNASTFGKLFQVQVDGQVYAQPLVMQGVNITTGANQGVHDVVFVATQHDTLYAIDATNNSGIILWQRSFLTTGLPGATSITTVPGGDTGSGDITVEIGITGTPVIDTATGTLYVIAKSKETVGGVAHYVQRLYAINMQNGQNVVTPFLIGDTSNGNTNNTSIYVYGNGDGHVTDPYNGTGQQVVQFNAYRQHQRPALTLINGVVYAAWASHGDNGPYHGWMVGFNKTTLALTGVLNTTPNGGLGGIWMAGGALVYDGTYFYFETGNGTFTPYNGSDTANNPVAPAPGPVTGLFTSGPNTGFPTDWNFGDSFVKVGLDPTTTPTNQNPNGWGLKVRDYFTPFNEQYLDIRDLDVGSAAPLILPDSAGSAAHPHLLIGSGKEGILYLIDRDNMGKFGLSNNIVQNTGNQLSGSLDTAAYYQGRIYYVEGYGGTAKTFVLNNGQIQQVPAGSGNLIETRSTDSFAFAGSTPSISSNGTTDGIVWDVDRGTNQLRAYSTDSYAIQLYHSGQAAGNRDALGAAVKFQVPTVANGHVYVGAGTGNPNNFLVVYGLIAPPSQAPAAPTNLAASAVSGSQINLTWTRNDVTPNTADSFFIEQSANGTTGWTQVATAGFGSTTYAIGALTPNTTYFFRVRAHNIIGNSSYTNVASATTTNQVNSIDYPSGFASLPNNTFTFNGGATVVNGRIRLTEAVGGQARSVYANALQSITNFTTTFTYVKNGTADGATFVIQRDARGLTALGEGGGALGYGYETTAANRIQPSFAFAFNFYNGHPIGTDFLTNGNNPENGYTQTNINVGLDNTPITATLSYSNGVMTALLIQNGQSETRTFNVNLPSILGANTAYVGFTGGTGGLTAVQEIINWTYTPIVPPAMPTNLQATVTGYTAGDTTPVPLGAHLTWTAAAGASGYKIERKLGAAGTYAQIGTSATASFDDTGLATQSTYFYRVRANNAAGDGAYSSEVQVTTPALAPTPTNGQLSLATTTTIALQWTDNANNEDGFQIFRSINSGSFTLIASLPAATTPAPTTVIWTDMGLTPGARYDYHVQAFNLSGYSDFSGITTATKALAPTNLAAASGTSIGLTWTASSGANTYNVYRATSAGGPFTQIATGIVPTNYTDTTPPLGTVYYQVTAVTLGGESAVSNTATAVATAPPTVGSIAINGGDPQRSRVTSLAVSFSQTVTFSGAAANAFTLTRQSDGAVVGFTATVDNSGSATVVTLNGFTGPVEFGSLADGRYTLTVLASQVAGGNFDGNGDGTVGDNYVLTGNPTNKLFRLFGDADGDGDVDLSDFSGFRGAFGGGPSTIFDSDGDGDVDLNDFSAFRARFGTSI